MAAINHPEGGRFEGYGKPKMTPRHPKYAAAVVIKENGRDRLIRFGLQGADRFPKRKGESKADAAKRDAGRNATHKTFAAAQLLAPTGRIVFFGSKFGVQLTLRVTHA